MLADIWPPERAADVAEDHVHAGGDAGLVGRHRSTISSTIEAKARPMPRPIRRRRCRSPSAGVGDAPAYPRQRAQARPATSGTREPTRHGHPAGERAGQQHREGGRQQEEAGPGDRRAEAVAGARRRLDELRESARTTRTCRSRSGPARLVVHTAADRAASSCRPAARPRAARRRPRRRAARRPSGEQAEGRGGPPAPVGALADGDQQRHQPARRAARPPASRSGRGRGSATPARQRWSRPRRPRSRSAAARTASGSRGGRRSGRPSRCRAPPPMPNSAEIRPMPRRPARGGTRRG